MSAGPEQSKPEGRGTGRGWDVMETPRAYNVCVVETALGQEQKTCVSSRLLPPSSCVAPSKSLSASGGPHLRRLGGKLYGHHDFQSYQWPEHYPGVFKDPTFSTDPRDEQQEQVFLVILPWWEQPRPGQDAFCRLT